MSDAVWTNLITGVATVVVGVAGIIGTYVATSRNVESARQKDNFHVKKEHLETSMGSLGTLIGLSDFYRNESIQHRLPVDELLPRIRTRAKAVSDCMCAAPWVYSDEVRAMEARLRDLVVEAEYQRNQQLYPLGMDMGQAQGGPVPSEEITNLINSAVDGMFDIGKWASDRLSKLRVEYDALISGGVPR